MLWNKAIAKIETALANGANVAVRYHAKGSSKWVSHIADVEKVIQYEFDNVKAFKAVNVSHGQLLENLHVIDEVFTDYFFNTKFGNVKTETKDYNPFGK